jgi:syntaxin-binding protein 1
LASYIRPDGIEAINAMKDTLSSLPEFQELRIKFSTHINICQECKTLFEKRSLDVVAAIEQDMATGETVDGRKPKNAIMSILPLLDDHDIPYLPLLY